MEENPYKSPESGEVRRRWTNRSTRYLVVGIAMISCGGISWWLSWQSLILNQHLGEMSWGDVTFFGVLGALLVYGGLRVSLASASGK